MIKEDPPIFNLIKNSNLHQKRRKNTGEGGKEGK
jgi:hypothetical protein